MQFSTLPDAAGLYDPATESDSCGVAFLADLHGRASSFDRRAGADRAAQPRPSRRRRRRTVLGRRRRHHGRHARRLPARGRRRSSCPAAGAYAVGIVFLPAEAEAATARGRPVEHVAADEGLQLLGWRELPVDARRLGPTALSVMPRFEQLFVAGSRRADRARTRAAGLLPAQGRRAPRPGGRPRAVLPVAVRAHPRLQGHAHHRPARDASFPTSPTSGSPARSRWCTAGSRPTPSRPGRWRTRTGYIAHNGEINTIKGNRNWMRTREALLQQRPAPAAI